MSLHLVGSAVIEIRGNTQLDVMEDGSEPNKWIINGDAERLEIRVVSPGDANQISLAINGQVNTVAFSEEFDGTIVLTGSGSVGEIQTNDAWSDKQTVHVGGGVWQLDPGTFGRWPHRPRWMDRI